MTSRIYAPSSEGEVVEAIAEAAGAGLKLDIRGNGSKAAIGALVPDAAVLDMSRLAGVVDYDPAELVLTVRPGTPLSEISTLLAEAGQMFAFEPLDPAPMLGSDARATIGGLVAAGLAGSRRLTRGSVRDHLLGFSAVSGRGESFVAGGKVVKNVTGYDLAKLVSGSWGRLAALTELTLKVLPASAMCRTRVVSGLSPTDARLAMAKAMGSQADVAAAAFIPARDGRPSRTCLRLEGVAPSVSARSHILDLALGGLDVQDADPAQDDWKALADLSDFDRSDRLWRIVVPARALDVLAAQLDAAGARWLADWAGGLVWTDWSAAPAMLRSAVAGLGGHAMLLRADAETRAAVPAFQPLAAGVASLEERVRRSFDPSGVFETGRFGDPRAD